MRSVCCSVVALVLGLLVGCGSGGKPAPKPGLGLGSNPPKAAPAPAAPVADNAAPQAPPEVAATKGSPRSSLPRSRVRDNAIDESAPVFLAGEPTEYNSRYTIAGDGKTADSFVATLSTRPFNGSTFVVLASGAAAPASVPRPGTPLPGSNQPGSNQPGSNQPGSTQQGNSQTGALNATAATVGNGNASGAGKLPKGFVAAVGSEVSPEGWPLRIRCEADSSEMVFIPAGPSLLGIDGGPKNAGPVVGVHLDAFYVDCYEITAAQYETFRVTQKGPRKPQSPPRTAKDPLEPVLSVNWGEANAYAKWAGKELPTEAQWEKAARGSEGFRAPWGNGVHLWHLPRPFDLITPVGTFPTDLSPYGVYDMAGNAREWCQDWYQETAFAQLKAGKESTPRNPTGPKHDAGKGSLRVVKGSTSEWLACSRAGVPMTDRLPTIGFRCVLTLKPEPAPKTAEAGRLGPAKSR